ncbi:MAG: DUF3990 domain-containing protein [Bacteroidales bacterium]|nr:DUF3990 domain-containing protein [Bacteroidales bacterium]
MIKLYHGSDVEVKKIDLSFSLMRKDFGPGFYLSSNLKQARAFARYKADRPKSSTHKAVVSTFEVDNSCFTDGSLRIKRFSCYSEEWIDFIEEYREKKETDFDVIIGPIANDDVRTKFAMYEMGEITKDELLESLKYKHVTFQYCFKTEIAISKLNKI